MKKTWFSTLLCAISLLSSCTNNTDDKNTIRMGFTPSESSEKVTANGTVLADILGKATGLKFKIYVANDYTALIQALRSGQVDVAWLAPFAYVIAEKKAGAQLLLKSVRHGMAFSYSAIVVRQDSPYKTLDDLKGKDFAWTDPSSSTGHILPKSALVALGYDPPNFFAKQTFAGSHESLVLSIRNGSVAAGATYCNDAEGKDGSWIRYEKDIRNPNMKLRSIYVTPPMPSDTVSVSSQLLKRSPENVDKIKNALLVLNKDPAGLDALKNLYSIEGLIEAKPEEYEPLRIAAAKLGYSLESNK